MPLITLDKFATITKSRQIFVTALLVVPYLIFLGIRAHKNEIVRVKNEDYSGKVIGKKHVAKNRTGYDQLTILQNNKEINVLAPDNYHKYGDPQIFDVIEPGDYIIKKKGEYKYTLIQGNDTTIFSPYKDSI